MFEVIVDYQYQYESYCHMHTMTCHEVYLVQADSQFASIKKAEDYVKKRDGNEREFTITNMKSTACTTKRNGIFINAYIV